MDAIDWSELDWSADGPWLAMLLILVSGVALPVLLYNLFDHWASRRLRLDTVALATRYGGFMNSWAVFGRHAGEYRDIRPLFPGVQAAELARFHDNTATIVARFRSARAAAEAAEERFGSFAAAGVEYADAGIAFQAGGNERQGRSPYARGQWLVIGDTLFAFYAPDSRSLARRREATPALRARRFPGPLRMLHSRTGHLILTTLWIAAHVAAASLLLEKAAFRAATAEPIAESELRSRIAGLEPQRDSVRIIRVGAAGELLATRVDDARNLDLDFLAGRIWSTGLQMELVGEYRRITVLPLVGQIGEPSSSGSGFAPPERWHNNFFLIEPGDPMLMALRETVRAAGWDWQPVLWPLPKDWRPTLPF